MNSLASKINSIIVVGLFAIVAFTSIYLLNLFGDLRNENRAFVDNICATTVTTVEDRLGSIEKAATTLAHNKYISQYYNDDDLTSRMQLKPVIDLYASYVLSSNDDILSVSYFDESNHMFTYGISMNSVLTSTLKREYPGIIRFEPMKPFFTGIIQTDSNSDCFAYIMPVYSTVSKQTLTRVATCVLLCNARSLKNILKQPVPQCVGNITLYDGESHIVTQLNQSPPANEEAFLSRSFALKGTDWNVVFLIDDVFSFQISQWSPALFSVLICTLMLLAIWLSLLKELVHPLTRLTEQLQRIKQSKGQLNTARYPYELMVVVSTINDMLKRLSQSEQERIDGEANVLSMQIHLKQAELNALQSQINPHFLYNTLECLRSIGQYRRVKEVVTISSAMADIFRYSIKGAPWVTIRQEMFIVEQYLRIIHIRFEDRFSVQREIAPDVLDCIIPKMILQPLIENAVYHGLELREEEGVLSISIGMEGEKLYLSVQDNGCGMAPEELESLQQRLLHEQNIDAYQQQMRSIGLVNINQRIRLLSGVESNMTVDSVQNVGTTVVLYLPITKTSPAIT